jgi:lipoate-protein ligase A
VVAKLAKATDWSLIPGEWTADERRAVDRLAEEKYRSASWNERR